MSFGCGRSRKTPPTPKAPRESCLSTPVTTDKERSKSKGGESNGGHKKGEGRKLVAECCEEKGAGG